MEGKNTIVITGAAGFLGSHLCDRYLSEGQRVIGIDNLITGDKRNITQHADNSDFLFIEHDICKPIRINEDIDYILHFASPASPIDYMKLPIFTLKVGALGALNMLEMAKEKKARILLASTSEVYGDPTVDCQSESYFGNVNPVGPRSVYDEAKRFQESVTMAYHREFNLETRLVRIFNTYGPRMRLNDGRALPTFFGQALLDKDITIFGDGSQTRSFCFVDDLVEGIYRLLLSDTVEPVNIGNPDEISILDFAKEIVRLAGKKLNFVNQILPENDPLKRRPDIRKAKEVLGWEPKVSREEGLRITYEYFKSLPKLDIAPREFSIQ